MRFIWNCILSLIISDWAVKICTVSDSNDRIGFWLASMLVLVSVDILFEDLKEVYEERNNASYFPYVFNRRKRGTRRRG